MKKYFNLILVSSLAVLLSCNNENNSSPVSYSAQAGNFMSASVVSANNNEITIEKKLIKKGNVNFETFNLELTRKNIFDAIKKHNAYVSSDISYKNENKVSNTIEVRVPAIFFDDLLNDVSEGVEKFDSKNISISDVTEQFLDVQIRLKTKKKLEARYFELLKKAITITEIVQVEKQMSQLRSEIESVEGRLKYLKNQVSYSTLNITFYKKISSETNFVRKFKNGFKNGLDNLVWFFIYVANVWPFIIIFFIVIFIFKRWIKNKSN